MTGQIFYPEWVQRRRELARDVQHIFMVAIDADTTISYNSVVGMISSLLHMADEYSLDPEVILQVAYQTYCNEAERVIEDKERVAIDNARLQASAVSGSGGQ